MCGIHLSIFRDCGKCSSTVQLEKLIGNRGPNSNNHVKTVIGNGWNCELSASVLWTQGDKVKVQPLNSNGSFLLWNGDVFYGLPNSGCDSEAVFAELLENGLSTFPKICGPYAFIFYDAIKDTLWFGRDVLGRQSLLWNMNSSSLLLTSVCPRTIFVEEVPNCGIFKIDLSNPEIELHLHPWSHLAAESISVKFSYSLKRELYHPYFVSPKEFPWYNKEPEVQDVEFLNGLVGATETTIFQLLTRNPPICLLVQKLKNLLIESVRRRLELKPSYCSNCISSLSNCSHSKVAVLFSGGLDSTILALISSYVTPVNDSIDLLNVAFDRNDSKQFLVPDRKNGLESLKELSVLTPQRQWNFVEINVKNNELDEYRKKHIADLIHPLSTILDDSLGCALWFAARGKGILNGQTYTSPARIVLLGMGADEIFGGYSRHRNEFKRNGWSKLGLELIEELRNISKRNLGRDNRIVTDHGRQPRIPFLDEKLLHFTNSLPPWYRCCFMPNMPPGIGDKLLLRTLAWDLGLRYSSKLPKKAMQFGSKIANPKEKGHELSDRLLLH